MARLIDRLRQEYSVRVLSVFALAASQRSTSVALSSRSFRAPSAGMTWTLHSVAFFETVRRATGTRRASLPAHSRW